MGVTCKPIGKMASIMKKLDNQLEADRKSSKENKEDKKKK